MVGFFPFSCPYFPHRTFLYICPTLFISSPITLRIFPYIFQLSTFNYFSEISTILSVFILDTFPYFPRTSPIFPFTYHLFPIHLRFTLKVFLIFPPIVFRIFPLFFLVFSPNNYRIIPAEYLMA